MLQTIAWQLQILKYYLSMKLGVVIKDEVESSTSSTHL